MRLELAKLFLAAEPVDPAASRAVLRQGLAVYSKFIKEGDKTFPWLAGRFDIEFDGAIFGNIENNPAFEWVKDVQRNAASIVANAEATGAPGTDANTSASSWDLSSVMESPPAFPDEMEGNRPSMNTPPTDALAPTAISNPETDAAATRAPGLTDVPKAPTELPTVEGLEASLKEQFSSERFGRAMSTLEQYGPEEGLRRLRENDPEVASQIEQHRNRSRSEDLPIHRHSRPVGTDKSGQVGVEVEEECSPCEENLKRLKEAMERWEREHKTQAIDRGDTE